MRYDKIDIPGIQLEAFMTALGHKPVESFNNIRLYYTPYRDDPQPMFVVNTSTNMWYDHATDQGGDLIDLAVLKMNSKLYKDPRDFILKYMNEYEEGKEKTEVNKQDYKPTPIQLDINKIKLTDFMKALGQESPVAVKGNLKVYNVPYVDNPEPTMLINPYTNLWRDTKSGAYGGIYDLAYELTGTSKISDLRNYIVDKMCALYAAEDKRMLGQEKNVDESRQETKEPPKRKMHL